MKNKKGSFLIKLVGAIALLGSLLTLITGSRVYKKTFKAKPHHIKDQELHQQRMATLDEYQHQKMLIESSENGYHIDTLHIKSQIESEHAIILVHGLYSNYYDLLPTAFRYLKDGCNVILYNQRQSGETGGNSNTFGLYERFDLEEVATIARRIYPDGKIGVHGFSMGAATAIMQSELNETSNLVDFYILDAPYHTMASAVELAARRGKDTSMPPWFVKFSGNAVLRLKEGVSYADIAPIDVISKSTRPILLIHGDQDNWTLPDGSRQLLEAISHDKCRLETFPEAGHCVIHLEDEDEYFKRIHQFIADFL